MNYDLEKSKIHPIIGLIDMDCFYVQVELADSQENIGKPSAVAQYTRGNAGGLIAVSYEAREKGISRSIRPDEAKKLCPDLHIFTVPEARGKADLTKYRKASTDVMKCIGEHAKIVERASIDEAYIDLTDEVDNYLLNFNSNEQELISAGSFREDLHAFGYISFEEFSEICTNQIGIKNEFPSNSKTCLDFTDEVRLYIGAIIIANIRSEIAKCTGFKCSAGISISKTVAKLACSLHKPNAQSVVTPHNIGALWQTISINKVRNLGGKMGEFVKEALKIDTMGQLSQFSYEQLLNIFGDKTGPWLFNLARSGSDDECVISRRLIQSVGCSKRFPGQSQLDCKWKVHHWLKQLSLELAERLQQDYQENGRVASHMSLVYRQKLSGGKIVSGSRVVGGLNPESLICPTGSADAINAACSAVLDGLNMSHQNQQQTTGATVDNNEWYPPLLELGLTAGKFKQKEVKNGISKYLINAPVKTLEKSKLLSDKVVSSTTLNKSFDTTKPLMKFKPINPLDQSFHEIPLATSNEIKDDTIMNTVESNKKPESSSKRTKPNENSLLKFFDKTSTDQLNLFSSDDEQTVPDNSEETQQDYCVCEQCHKSIIVWDLPEHLDWHFAKSFQKELSDQVRQEQIQQNQQLNESRQKRKKTSTAKTNKSTKKIKTSTKDQPSILQFLK